MDKEIKRLLIILSVLLAAAVLLWFLLSGYGPGGIEIHKGIRVTL